MKNETDINLDDFWKLYKIEITEKDILEDQNERAMFNNSIKMKDGRYEVSVTMKTKLC